MTVRGNALQAVFDAIKKIREGETVPVTIGKHTFPVGPHNGGPAAGQHYNAVVLCRLRGRMRFAHVSYKDAGPNPRLYDGSRYFVSTKLIYGAVMLPFEEAVQILEG